MDQVNWGIIGLGKIAHKMAQDLLLAQERGAVLYAVASRSQEKADEFGRKYRATKAYPQYKDLIQDPKVDVVYIATPHVMHADLSIRCMEAGKAVLCEKPLAMSEGQAQSMIDTAQRQKAFLMEGMWTRFMPSTEKVLDMLGQGVIGEIRSIRADFGYQGHFDPQSRLFKKELGGGALLDIGIYPLYLAQLLLGAPQKLEALAKFGPTQVDHSCNMITQYANGALGILDASLEVHTPIEAWIHGDQGCIRMHHRFHHATQASLYEKDELMATHDLPYVGNGYYHEALEVMDCLREGKTQSDKMSHQDSLTLMQSLDLGRQKIGLEYPLD